MDVTELSLRTKRKPAVIYNVDNYRSISFTVIDSYPRAREKGNKQISLRDNRPISILRPSDC